MGHLVAHRITGDAEKTPESFIEFNEKFCPGYEGNIVEVFADLFSLAVMLDTEYASLNPGLATFSGQFIPAEGIFVTIKSGFQSGM